VKRPRSGLTEDLSHRQLDALHAFEAFLVQRAVPAGAVAKGDVGVLWDRHILDSLRGVECLRRAHPVKVADVGSGAGLPGIPLAIALPDIAFHLLEPRRIRASLLEAAVAELQLPNVDVVPLTAEASGLTVDLATARALARPPQAWRIARAVLHSKGWLLLWAGVSWRDHSPHDGKVVICAKPLLEGQGPLVMMARETASGERGDG
jgi:16S rRNA (guanine527-N7)-methyltransferase